MRVVIDMAGLDGREATGLALYARRLAEALREAGEVELVSWKGAEIYGGPGGAHLYHHPLFFSPRVGRVRPCVVTVHDLLFEEFPEEYPLRLRGFMATAVRRAIRESVRVITPSHVSAEVLRERLGLPAEKVVVVPLAPALGIPDLVLRQEVRGWYDLQGPFFLHQAAAFPRKNLPLVLEAFQRVARRWSCQLLLCVSQEAKGQVLREIDTAGMTGDPNLRVVGYLPPDRLVALLAEATAFLYPSRGEGFGMPVLEAMACGTVAIVLRLSVMREVGGDAVVEVEDDADELAGAMEDILRYPERAAELALRGNHRAAAFTWERVARETLAVYRAALGAG